MSDQIKNFNHFQWYKLEEGIITIGINDNALEDITEITAIDIPPEQEKVDSEMAFGSLETDDGTLDLMSPFEGTIIEVNTQAVEDPQMVIDDPFEEGWLVRIEVTEDLDDADEEDEEEDDEADDEDFEEEETSEEE